MIEMDMTGSNAWAFHAEEWLMRYEGAKLFETSKKEIKALVEPEVRLAYGHGIKANRSKSGAITIKEMKL